MSDPRRPYVIGAEAPRPSGRSSAASFALYATLGLGSLATIGLAGVLGALFFVYLTYAGDYVPIQEKLRLTNAGLTEIYDRGGPQTADGKPGTLLGALSNTDAQLLDPVKLANISPWMTKATVSTEDNSFYENPGVNITGLMRAGIEFLTGRGNASTGGSSITQQLIKNVYICPAIGDPGTDACAAAPRTLDRKFREIAYALELQHDTSKDQVLEWYLNQISYADRYVGVQAAAQGYFHIDASKLTLAQAALLAGIPQSPTDYHPRLNCAKNASGECLVDAEGRTAVVGDAKKRQEDVLDLMVTHGKATRAEADAAKAETVTVYRGNNNILAGAFIDSQVEPRLERMCNAGLIKKLEAATDCRASVHSAGYKVTTSLDWAETQTAQKMVQDFVATGLKAGCNCNDAALLTIDPASGQILVYVPNRDPANIADRRVAGDIDQLTEINQPGSSFKPVVYLTFFDKGVKAPMSSLWDTSPLNVEGASIVNPRNDGKTTEGLISARAAMGGSQNVGAFRSAAETGVDNVIDMAKKMGITTLQQNFDPTFYSHQDVTYGASIATGGANIKAVDMAYVDTVIANMGLMVGTPSLAKTLDPKDLRSTGKTSGADFDEAQRQAREFARGNLRLPGTRELDPIVVLQVRDHEGKVIWTQGEPEKKQVVNAGSVWLVHTIMSDCTARFIIWACGANNNDNQLDFFLDGKKIPGGVKTGTQQGAKIADTLETWMTGYSRYAGTAVWVGNATNELVVDGAAGNFAASNTTIHLFKNWMGEYHRYLKANGAFDTPATFDSVQPKNVAFKAFRTTATDRGVANRNGLDDLCDQVMDAWQRTDVTYPDECESREIDTRNGLLATDQTPVQFREKRSYRKLPSFAPEAAAALARALGIPLAPTEKSSGQGAVVIANPTDGAFIATPTQVRGTVALPNVQTWKLEVGSGAAPNNYREFARGTTAVNDANLGLLELNGLPDGVHTIRLSADDGKAKPVAVTVTFNIRRASPSPSPSPSASPSGTPRPSGTPGTATPRPSASPSPGASASPSPSPSPTGTRTPPATSTATPRP